MNDPRTLSPDNADLVTLCERLQMLPQPHNETDFGVLAGQIMPLIKAHFRTLKGADHKFDSLPDLAEYAIGLRDHGEELAADGVALLMLRWGVETERQLRQEAAGDGGPADRPF
jgi:hypothetical protein